MRHSSKIKVSPFSVLNAFCSHFSIVLALKRHQKANRKHVKNIAFSRTGFVPLFDEFWSLLASLGHPFAIKQTILWCPSWAHGRQQWSLGTLWGSILSLFDHFWPHFSFKSDRAPAAESFLNCPKITQRSGKQEPCKTVETQKLYKTDFKTVYLQKWCVVEATCRGIIEKLISQCVKNPTGSVSWHGGGSARMRL